VNFSENVGQVAFEVQFSRSLVFNGSFTSEEFTRIKEDNLATLCKFDKIKQKYIMYVQQLQGSSGSTQDPLLFSRDQHKNLKTPWPLITKENNVHWRER